MATAVTKVDLAARLFDIKETSDVEAILEEVPDQAWLPLGGKRGNLASVQAIADSADALVERVTNGFDAVIEREVLKTGRSDFQSPRQAVQALIGVPGGRLSLWQGPDVDEKLRDLAQQVIVTMRDSGVEKHPTVVVTDRGVGQHASDFAKTLVSLNEENKRTKLYLMGAYGWGGATSFGFCKYAVFASRRDLALLAKGQADEVGWTVVRYNPLDDDPYSKHGLYEYLCVKSPSGPRVPTLAPATLPADYRAWTGTACTLVEYQLTRFSDSTFRPDRSAYQMFNALLFDPILPMLLRDERPKAIAGNKTSALTGLVINGTATRLTRDAGKKEERRRIEYQNSYEATLDGDRGSATIRYYVLYEKGDSKKDWEPISSYVLPEQAVTITHNGQRQGSWRRELFNQLGLLTLSKFMIVQVDCDALSWRAKRDVFTTVRGLKDSELAKQLREMVSTAMQSDRSLYDLDHARKEIALGRRSAQHAERIKKMLQSAIDSVRQGTITLYRKVLSTNHDLPVFGDQPLVQSEPRTTAETESIETATVPYPQHPTELRVVNPIVQVPAGGKAVVKLWMNAQDGYIAPGGGVGKLASLVTKGSAQFRLVGYSALRGGYMRCTMSAEAGHPGDQGRVVFTVLRPGQLPLIDEADLVITEPPVPRVRPAKKDKGSEPGPNVHEVYREDWETFDLDEKRVARVEQNSPGPGQTTFYVNWDYPPLDAKLLAERKVTEQEIEPYKQKFCAAMALAAWLQESEKDGEPPSQEARDAELRRAAQLFLFSQFVLES